MKLVTTPALVLSFAAGAVLAQVHPGFTLQTATFSPANPFFGSSTRPLVGGMDVFPDGRVAVAEWGVPASVFILSGLAGGSSNIQVTRFAKGLDNVMGLKIVGNVIYVMEKEALTQLVDTNGDGTADEYNSVNQAFASNNSMLNFSYDLGYLGGSFYAAMSSDVHVGGQDYGSSDWPGTQALSGRSTMYKLNMDGTSSAVACGFRNPNGMGVNGSDIFVSENQGSWTPSSKVINVRQGRFYGHRTNPANACQTANNNVESPPVIWNNWDNNETGRSSGNPIVLQRGRFAGHILVPDLVNGHANPVFRVFVETVGGELQGCVLPFLKSGTLAGVHRIHEAPDGAIYLGNLGASGGWGGRGGMTPGFQALRDNGAAVFEVKAVRSLGNQNFELEFTKPVGANANQTGTYTVSKWQQIAAECYGCGNNSNNTGLTVNSATVSTDRMKVNLQIGNLTTGWVVKFVFNGLTAQDGSAFFTNFAVYTLNRFGPGTDYAPAPVSVAPSHLETGWNVTAGNGAHVVRFLAGGSARRTASLYDLRGARLFEIRSDAPELRLPTGNLPKGMYLLRVLDQGRTGTRALFLP